MSFVAKAISANGHRFFYLNANVSGGKSAWYFVLVNPVKEEAFSKLDYFAPFCITDYGNIIESGYGEAAPEEVIEQINSQYKTNFSNS